jgi:mannose/fructose/N-acetylgalactosamine-specific phosphotransferase system component IIC
MMGTVVTVMLSLDSPAVAVAVAVYMAVAVEALQPLGTPVAVAVAVDRAKPRVRRRHCSQEAVQRRAIVLTQIAIRLAKAVRVVFVMLMVLLGPTVE